MTYYYDESGWLTTQPNESRRTDFPPLESSEIPQGYRLHWTGTQWELLEFSGTLPNNDGRRLINKADFKMRIPPNKYGKIRDLSVENSTVWAFLDVLNDPTLIEIDLDSEYLIAALVYIQSVVPNDISEQDIEDWLR